MDNSWVEAISLAVLFVSLWISVWTYAYPGLSPHPTQSRPVVSRWIRRIYLSGPYIVAVSLFIIAGIRMTTVQLGGTIYVLAGFSCWTTAYVLRDWIHHVS